MSQAAGYREWQPGEGLARHLICTWAGRLGADGTPFVERVLPDGCVDIIWDGARLFVAGPDTGPVAIEPEPGGFYVGARFRPGMAPTIVGVPASELLDLRVDAADIPHLAGAAAALSGRLHETRSLRQAALVLESAVLHRLPDARRPDDLVEAAVAILGDAAGLPGSPVAGLADELGLSERQLHRRCIAAIGYGPKTLDRVLRFRRFLALADGQPQAGLADLAAAAGYADQAHLTRECGRLAGVPPSRLVPRLTSAA
jgi:AraC-like DNA-binding protein